MDQSRHLRDKFLGLLFPARCVNCGQWGDFLCASCYDQVLFLDRQFCPICHRSAIDGLTHPGCAKPWGLDGSLSASQYKGPMRKLIACFKYKPYVKAVSLVIHKVLANYFAAEEAYFTEGNVISAVPLHWIRKNERGFNQAEILAKLVAEVFQLPFNCKILKRVKRTEPQASLSREGRQTNTRGAFELCDGAKELIKGCSFVMVDDVWTTGSTLKECGKVLKRAGAERVYALTLSRG